MPTHVRPRTIFLHWCIAILMISMLAIGLYMHRYKIYTLYPVHKSIGALMLPLVVYRVGWRAFQGWIQPDYPHQLWQKIAAAVSHSLLLALTVFIPVSGVAMSILSGRGLSIFGLSVVSQQRDANSNLVPISNDAAQIMHWIHFNFNYLLIIILLTHITAAAVHHFWWKDRTLEKMLTIKT
jgi:cytochrome b561